MKNCGVCFLCLFMPSAVQGAGHITYVSLTRAHQMWTQKKFDFVIDVRGPENASFDNGYGWNHGHIPGSFALPGLVADPMDAATVDQYKTTACQKSRILVHCWTGVAGERGALALADMGFKNVYAINGSGIWQWEAAGYPMEYGETFHPGMKPQCAGGVTYLSLPAAYKLWSAKQFDFVIDVRGVENATFANGWGWNHGHIPGSFALPGLISDPMDTTTVTPYKTASCSMSKILVHCWVGVAGRRGALELAGMGFSNVYAIENAGIWEWASMGYPMQWDDTWVRGTRPTCAHGCEEIKVKYKKMACCGNKSPECIGMKKTWRENSCCKHRL